VLRQFYNIARVIPWNPVPQLIRRDVCSFILDVTSNRKGYRIEPYEEARANADVAPSKYIRPAQQFSLRQSVDEDFFDILRSF